MDKVYDRLKRNSGVNVFCCHSSNRCSYVMLLQVDFHDTGSGPRVPAMTDYFGFTMASLNEKGSVFANPCKGEKNMSTLMYRPFSSWASNSEVKCKSIFVICSYWVCKMLI